MITPHPAPPDDPLAGLLVVGANHKVAPLEVRERLSFHAERVPAALQALSAAPAPGCPSDELALLSTCNRTEIYAWSSDPQAAAPRLARFLAQSAGLPPAGEQAGSLFYTLHGPQAARHLLLVACGLDSLILGENEILGQVKDAAALAQAAGTCGAILPAWFRSAAQAGKRVRSETSIGRAAMSVATVVAELAGDAFGELAERRALLIGAGKISSMAAHALARAGLRWIVVANRTYDRACRLAQALHGEAVRFDSLAQCLAEADIVICSTGAPHLVLHAPQVASALARRPGRPLLVVDLAVPRNADPAIAGLPGARLVDIDDLDGLVQARHPLAAAARCQAEAIVAEELAQFAAWCRARRCAPLLRALHEKAAAICEEQVALTLRRMGDLTPAQQHALAAMGQAIANKLLHDPVTYVKEMSGETIEGESTAVVMTLFGLD